MDKEKIIQGGIWLSGFSILIILSSITLYAGFNNVRHGSHTVLIIGLILIPAIFFCAYKGFKSILDAIFEK
ncbi:MAG: hypothetical protein HN522_04555 [Flavobacteriales bacterium]|jgi:hypothetical protein|nr:hypothetical protein [Flavobacteriales bacterium]MBT5090312.1 hypothetical protein [Flavobacteriales bacterium]MBT5750569.1 hypothetical protein [Flavobacteriales bacterium]